LQNSEIVLGTITNIESAKDWLSGTFLYVRLQKNPTHYQLDNTNGSCDINDLLDEICRRDINLLQEAELVSNSQNLRATVYGNSVAQYSVRFETAKKFLSLPPKATISEIVSLPLAFDDAW
jgi:ATP-dependent DNA helicase HFM1/MER3